MLQIVCSVSAAIRSTLNGLQKGNLYVKCCIYSVYAAIRSTLNGLQKGRHWFLSGYTIFFTNLLFVMISARKGKLLSFQYFCALHLRWISCYFIFLLLIHHKNDFKCEESPSNQPSSGQLQKARPQPGEQWHWGSGVTIPAAHLEAGDKWDAFPVMAFYSALINTALAWVFPRSNVNPKLSCIKA